MAVGRCPSRLALYDILVSLGTTRSSEYVLLMHVKTSLVACKDVLKLWCAKQCTPRNEWVCILYIKITAAGTWAQVNDRLSAWSVRTNQTVGTQRARANKNGVSILIANQNVSTRDFTLGLAGKNTFVWPFFSLLHHARFPLLSRLQILPPAMQMKVQVRGHNRLEERVCEWGCDEELAPTCSNQTCEQTIHHDCVYTQSDLHGLKKISKTLPHTDPRQCYQSTLTLILPLSNTTSAWRWRNTNTNSLRDWECRPTWSSCNNSRSLLSKAVVMHSTWETNFARTYSFVWARISTGIVINRTGSQS